MSFDYKQVQSPRGDASGSFLIGLFFGFLLGLGVAAGIAIYFFKTPIPFADRPKAQDKPLASDQKATEAATKSAKAEEKPRFDFYRILPGKEEPVTDRQLRDASKQAAKTGAPKESYFLQVGAFPNPADADNLKARIAMMGMEANVEPANVAGKGVWYRVRLGPYTRVDEINRVRQQLTQNGVEVSLVRITDTTTN
ncbi:MAG TPA: SPOR domain-containing protein [Burkholderiales bacterium]|nr:SPOR domain-containing protein [Burkholderiales bacterium]